MWHYLIWSSLKALPKVRWFFLFLVGVGITSGAFAQNLTPDPKAPVSKRPSVVAAPNGVPLVDIAKPNSKGLSHNLFREFSVGTQGAILNNSRQEASRSVLGGVVPGNPNLKNGAATVILNEVTGVSRSQLQGYLEVHGQRADVIVANPNGITCNGCGFINTPRATLTTGIPEIDSSGRLTGFKVENGDVTFGTLGANFSNVDIVDVLSRKIFINGRIDAKTLRLIAGHNRVKYNDVENPTSLSTSTSNEIVIDSSLLGGMYVERLSIVANNKGTGVRMRGDMASSVGDISLRADGSITVGRVSSGRKLTVRSKNKGVVGQRISSKGALSVGANESISFDAVSSDETITIDSQLGGATIREVSAFGHISISGLNDLVLDLVEGNQDVTLTSSAGDILLDQSLAGNNTKIVAANKLSARDIVSGNQLMAQTVGNITLSGVLLSGGDLAVASTSGALEAETILSEGNMVVSAQNGIAAREDIVGLGSMNLTALNGDIAAKNISSVGTVLLTSQNLLVAQDVLSEQTIMITTTAKTQISGEINAELGDVNITAGTSIAYGKLSAGRDAILTSSAGDVSLENETAVGRNLEIIVTGATLDWSNEVFNLGAPGQMNITATNADLSGGTFTFGDVFFSISNNLDLSNASVTSDAASFADITVNTKSLTHTDTSELVAGGNLYLTLSSSFTNRMVIGAFGDTVMKVTGDLTNIDTGLIGAANHVGIFVTGTITNKDGAGLWATDGDLIIAGSDAGITHLAGGGFLLPGDLNALVKNVKVLNSSAVIEAGRDIVIATGEFENKRTSFVLKTTDDLGTKSFFSTTANRKNPFGNLPIHRFDLNRLLTFCSWCEYPDVPAPPPTGGTSKTAGVDFLFLQNPDSIVERDDYFGGTPTNGGPQIPTQNLSQDDFLFVASAYDPTGLPFTLPNTLEWARLGKKERGIDESNSTPEARLHAGRNLSIISSGDISNKYSLITANNNLHLEGRNLENVGENFSKTIFLDTAFTDFTAGISMLFSGWNATEFTNAGGLRLFESSGGVIREVPGSNDQFFLRWTLATENGGVSGKITAGGILTGDFRGKIDNTTIAEGVTPNGFVNAGSFGGQNTLALLAPAVKQPLNLDANQKQLNSLGALSNLAGGSSLFQNSQNPNFLVETRAPFIDVSKFYGGSYFMDRIGYYSNQSYASNNGWGFQGNKTDAPSNTLPKYGALGAYNDGRGYRPDSQVVFLGDAFFETRLIEQAILNKTGKRLLDEAYETSTTQLKTLIENGVQSQKGLRLSVGVALTHDQVNALKKDIVWYVERKVNGKKVLVPEVYLSHRTTFDLANDGAVIQGKQVNLTSRDDITNRGGRISSDESLSLKSSKGTITLAAVSQRRDLGSGLVREWLGRAAKFSAGGDLTLLAGKNIEAEGSTIGSGADLVLGAQDGVKIKSLSLTNTDLKYGRKRYRGETWRTDHILSEITAGGDATILAESGNLEIEGGRLSVEGSGELRAGQDVTIAAVQSEQGFDISHKRGFNKENQTITNENYVATGKDLTIRSGNDTKIKASDVIAGGKREGDLNIIAGGKATIESGEDVYDRDYYYKKKGTFSSKEERKIIHDEQTVSSRVGATGDVNIIAQKDVNIKASQLDAGQDLRIAAGTKLDENNQLTSSGKDANVNITTNREDDSSYHYQKKSGFFAEGGKGSFSAGYRKEKHEIDTKTQTHVLAALSAGQSVIITATKDIDAHAPLIAANENIELAAGRDVNIKSVQDLFDHHESHKVSQFGVTVSVFENITSSFKALTNFDTGKGSGGAKAISTISSGLRAIDAVSTLTGGHLAGVNVNVGFSKSKSTLALTYKTAKGGVLQAGKDIKIDAGRDINTQGTIIIANDNVKLDAGRDLNLQAAKSTSKEKSSDKSTSVGAGITVGVGITGVGISGNFQGSKSKANSEGESTTYLNTKIIAGKKAELNAGRDTTLKGARVEADTIIATVGRDLTIESLQNTSRFKSSSKGGSFGVSADLGGWSSGINITPDNLLNNALNNGDGLPLIGQSGFRTGGGSSWNIGINGSKGKGDYAWVEEQSGLVGDKRVDVTVEGNTDLIGGIIASKSKDLTLDTGTLTYSDLQDRDKSRQVGGSISIGGPLSGDGDGSAGKLGDPSNLNVTIEGQYAKKDKEGITRATVGEGEIIIRDKDKQKELEDSGKTQKLANINRDLNLAQEVTKDEETEINLYVSDSSLKVAGKFLETLVKAGSLSVSKANQLKDVMERLEDVDPTSLSLCTGGGQGFNWHDVLFSKAYAQSGDGCILRFKGEEALISLSPEEKKAFRDAIVKGAEADIKNYLSTYQTLAALQDAGTISDSQLKKLHSVERQLQSSLMLFALCSDHPSDLRNANFLPLNSGFESMLSFAENYRVGGDAIALRLQQERAQGGGKLTAAVDAARKYDTINTIDALFALNGISTATPEVDKEKIYDETLNILTTKRPADYGVVFAREQLISLDLTLNAAFDHLDESSKQAFAQKVVESGIIQNTALGVKGFKTFVQASEPFAKLMSSIGAGLGTGTVLIGGGLLVAELPAAGAALVGCARDFVCRAELMTGLASAVLEEVSGGGQMVAGTTKVISKTADALLETANNLATGLLKQRHISCANGFCGSAVDGVYTNRRALDNEFPELVGVNPHFVKDADAGINTNCVSCVNAAVERLTGKNLNAVADPSNGYLGPNELLPSAPFGFSDFTTPSHVTSRLINEGDGAIAIVRIQQATDVEHAIIGVNKGGKVYYIDPQRSEIVDLKSDLIVKPGYR